MKREGPNDADQRVRVGWTAEFEAGGTMRRSGFLIAWAMAVSGVWAMGQVPVAAQPAGRMSGGMAWPANLPEPMPLWAEWCAGRVGIERGGYANDCGFYSCVESDEDSGGSGAGRRVSAPVDGEGRGGCGGVAERAWGGSVCAAVPAGAEVSLARLSWVMRSGRFGRCGRMRRSMGLRRTTSGCGDFRRADI